MNRRKLIATLAGAGAVLAMTPGCAAPKGNGDQSKKKKSVENIPVVLEVAICGGTTKAMNPVAPETDEEKAAEIIRCFDAGATIVHTHSNQPTEDLNKAAQPYIDHFTPVWEKHPHAIVYATANFSPAEYNRTHRVWSSEAQCGHHRILAEKGVANMILLDTGVTAVGGYDEQGLPSDKGFYWYGFWPGDAHIIKKICDEFGTGASISVFEPGWMKNVIAMARGGSLPRGSKLNIYFGGDGLSSMAPAIPEALELYIKMMEGLDLKWSVGYMGKESVMDTPLARMALERGGSFRVGLEDWPNGTGNVEQLKRAKEIIDAVGRPVVTGAEAIKYLDIPYAKTRPEA